MTLLLNPGYKQYSSFISRLPFSFQKEGKTIYKARNEIKVFEVEQTLLNVKQYKIPSLFNQIIYTFFRKPKCIRAYQFALRLREQGFETPQPIAYLVLKKKGLIERSYFISLQSSYERRFYEFGEGGIAGREDIIIAFARYTAQLHKAGIYHKDYSPGNILFHKENDKIAFSLVDLNRMEFGPVSLEKGYRSFARFWGKEDFFRLLAKEYALARQADVTDATRKILFYRHMFWFPRFKKKKIPFEYK